MQVPHLPPPKSVTGRLGCDCLSIRVDNEETAYTLVSVQNPL